MIINKLADKHVINYLGKMQTCAGHVRAVRSAHDKLRITHEMMTSVLSGGASVESRWINSCACFMMSVMIKIDFRFEAELVMRCEDAKVILRRVRDSWTKHTAFLYFHSLFP